MPDEYAGKHRLTPEAKPLSTAQKVIALVKSGLAVTRQEARAMLVDMGEIDG
jgi:hypothetical protein